MTDTSTKPSSVKDEPVTHRHVARTLLASVFGTFATLLIMVTILAVWVNRTLTNTETYTKTVAPLVTKPEVQQLIADRISTELEASLPQEEAAKALLPNIAPGDAVIDRTARVREEVTAAVLQVVS